MLSRLNACSRGAVAVEAAIVLPVLIMLLFAMIEFSLVFFTLTTMQLAARDLSRQLAVNTITVTEAQAAAAAYVPGWASGALDVDVVQTTPLNPSTNQIEMTVSLPAASASPTGVFLGLLPDWTLSASVVMKQEMPL